MAIPTAQEKVLGRVDNFGAGPAALPTGVLLRMQEEMLNYAGTGMSVFEISHRSEAYNRLQAAAVERLRRLLQIPEDYRVLFLQGGASLQFAMVAQNFISSGRKGAYVLTGTWAEKAYQEAGRVAPVRVAASTKDEGYRRLPEEAEIQVEDSDAYLHFTSNNTIMGSQWPVIPTPAGVPVVVDMSSDILSRPVPIRDYHLVYAGAQKNLGVAGLTVVILKDSWLEENPGVHLPKILSYKTHADADSRYNTPPVFAVYALEKVLEWVEEQGGLVALAERNRKKAEMLYTVIDASDGFYTGVVDPAVRSQMNVTFRLANEDLTREFVAAAKQAGMVGLGGHRSVGGCRASLYNAVNLDACARLCEFMRDFARKHRG
ncbi:3-phosphoserine/phosphohydroxythreonine transaminase [Alicyclobacillus herbarius]|uniref:3-phosphoserine/phosphohydroxythreonine transaminase n=1 Tax=Alicyclobacillus herbarius TaxID=122960 RepID=UPI0004069778|nr:3-phosphoserine/phosphohydroxythreonine transaminase [Alicyclobacillus herbarius]